MNEQPHYYSDISSAYRERERTSWERFLDRFKPRSAAMRTTLLVTLVSLFTLWMSVWLFWRTLYLPEIKQHAKYIAIQIDFLTDKEFEFSYRHQPVKVDAWMKERLGVEVVDDADLFPNVKEKYIAEIITDRLGASIAKQMNVAPEEVTVYFQFKPTPQLWIKTPAMPNKWLKEPLPSYANYSAELIFAWLLGIPFLTMVIVLILVRQLNRPLKRLQNAANRYTKTGTAPYLVTNHGPLEIRQVNLSFNQMMSNIQQTEQERRIMLAGISHDLRTPLTRIRLTAEMIPDDFVKEGLIYDVDDMDAILNQFISFMRDGSDEEIELIDVNLLLQEIVVQFQTLDIRFQARNIPKIPARTLSLKRLVANLVNNAKKYGAEPIEIDAYREEDALVIRVADNGTGIDNKDIESLMQPFTRGESARTVQGSGLGLAIVKRIVELHQGRIVLANQKQGGLEVKVYLPLELPVADEKNENAFERFRQKITEHL
ncbi:MULTISPECIES: ATP-binding protein [unclassified Acinetobacter]|uniref:ATP-binding protein n=1 Tax=unclassified Acinetobacter TaxID=196816 RepID=UPI0035B84760